MLTSDGQPKLTGNDPPFRAPASGFLRQILTAVVSIAVLVAAFALSLVIFAALAAIALIAGGYVWWRTRALRRQMRERPPGGRVIDGEVMRDSSTTDPD
jgi:hypothetical protein